MHLSYTLDELNAERWEQLFGAFTKANRSHWRGAPYEAVVGQLKGKKSFEFTVTGMNTWTSKFRLTVLDGGVLDAEFVANAQLPKSMHAHLAAMQRVFEEEVAQLR